MDIEKHNVELIVQMTMLQMLNELSAGEEIFADIDVFELQRTEKKLETITHASSGRIDIKQAPLHTSDTGHLKHLGSKMTTYSWLSK